MATSDDVPGLATEAPTLEALTEKLRILIPELLEVNQLLTPEQPEAISEARQGDHESGSVPSPNVALWWTAMSGLVTPRMRS